MIPKLLRWVTASQRNRKSLQRKNCLLKSQQRKGKIKTTSKTRRRRMLLQEKRQNIRRREGSQSKEPNKEQLLLGALRGAEQKASQAGPVALRPLRSTVR